MKTKRKLLLSVLMIAFAVFMALSASACNLLTGLFAMTDFVVDTTNVTKTYDVGDEVNLDGLLMKAIYNDGSEKPVALEDVKIFLGEEDITDNLNKITATAGNVTIKIVYETTFGTKSGDVTILVRAVASGDPEQGGEGPEQGGEVVKTYVWSFSQPTFIAGFKNSIDNATDDNTSTSFESNFYQTTNSTYTVGDDNAFKFIPDAMDEDYEEFDNIIVSTTVKIKVDTEYVELTKTLIPDSNYEYEYKYNDVVMLVEYASENKFDFASNAIGNVFAISVLPDEKVYEFEEDVDAIEFELKVVDGYNVYSVEELTIIDNSGRSEWLNKKASLGLTGVDAKGIVLHSDFSVTKDILPSSYMYTLPESYNIFYKLGEKTGAPEEFGLERTFLWNHDENNENPDLFLRKIANGESFNIYGNFYSIDLSKLPLVASFDASGKLDVDGNLIRDDSWFEEDFSNTSFLKIEGEANSSAIETVLFENVAISGNAKADQLVVVEKDAQNNKTVGYKGEYPVYCGGVIFVKMADLSAEIENVRANHFFITFYGESDADNVGPSACTINLNKTKCFDAASNALFLYGKANVTVSNSQWQRAGGPLIVAKHYKSAGGYTADTMPTIDISSECVMEAFVTGGEAWFISNGAAPMMMLFMGVDQMVLQNQYMKASMFKDGKMNFITLLMPDGGLDALTNKELQGRVTYGNTTLDRINDYAEHPVGFKVHYILGNAPVDMSSGDLETIARQIPPIFNFGTNVYYVTPSGVDNAAGMMADVASTLGEDGDKRIAMNYGGFGLLLGLFDYNVVS